MNNIEFLVFAALLLCFTFIMNDVLEISSTVARYLFLCSHQLNKVKRIQSYFEKSSAFSFPVALTLSYFNK